jgi:glutathione reductase (NADPH)
MPQPLGIPGEEFLCSSTEFLDLPELPRRIVFVGAGYISFEFSHIAARAGANVTLVARKPLPGFDATLVERLVAHTREIGVDVRLDTEVIGVERVQAGGSFRVTCRKDGTTSSVDADLVVHGAGRVPSTARLDVQRGNVRIDDRGAIEVNEYLQSVTNPLVYAAGDVTLPPGKLPLTPVAAHEGAIVASNLLRGNTKRPNYVGTPSVVFTIPPLASVGLTEHDARELGVDIRVRSEDTSTWYSNRRTRTPVGAFKTIVDASSDHVLGAHVLGDGADEAINLFSLAIRLGVPSAELKRAIYAYPTSSSDLPYML